MAGARALCESEGVEATALGRFVDSGRLTLRYQGRVVADLSMSFLHEGRPAVVRRATFSPPAVHAISFGSTKSNLTADLIEVLAWWDAASKEWIIRQYDHEVQGRTVLKPLVGAFEDGPGDAAVVLPTRGSQMGLAVACGIGARSGRLDPYAMAACAIDEAVRNCVAVGADPSRIALLDNFCWGNPSAPKPSARSSSPPRRAATWPWRTRRRSFRVRIVSTTNINMTAKTSRSPARF